MVHYGGRKSSVMFSEVLLIPRSIQIPCLENIMLYYCSLITQIINLHHFLFFLHNQICFFYIFINLIYIESDKKSHINIYQRALYNALYYSFHTRAKRQLQLFLNAQSCECHFTYYFFHLFFFKLNIKHMDI